MVDWDAIVSRDGPVVWRTVYRLVGNRADAEDCFQETFVSALAAEHRMERIQNMRALLQRLATARALDRLRRRYRRTRHEHAAAAREEPGATDPNPERAAEAAELSERLRSALALLPAKQAQAFCLFNLDGWDYARIARHLDLSIGGVGTLLHRARQRLQTLLAAWEGEAPAEPNPPSQKDRLDTSFALPATEETRLPDAVRQQPSTES